MRQRGGWSEQCGQQAAPAADAKDTPGSDNHESTWYSLALVVVHSLYLSNFYLSAVNLKCQNRLAGRIPPPIENIAWKMHVK